MPPISATELDLLNFFECEPKRTDADISWDYNDLAYERREVDLALSFAVAPAYKDIRIILQRADVKYHNDNGHEILEVVINDRDHILLRLKPTFLITHLMDEKV